MDQVLLSLGALALIAVGVLSALIRFRVPQLHKSFWGENPFAAKHATIESIAVRYYTAVAMAGILLQACIVIAGPSLPTREHSTSRYAGAAVAVAIASVILMYCVAFVAQRHARGRWLPVAIDGQRDLYFSAVAILENDGWRADQLSVVDSMVEDQRELHRKTNFSTARTSLDQIAELLEEEQIGDIRLIRKSLSKYFET